MRLFPKIPVLFVFTSANLQMTHSHWGIVVESLNRYAKVYLLVDEEIHRLPASIDKKDVCVIRTIRILRENQVLRYLFLPLLALLSGLKSATKSSVIIVASGGPSNIIALMFAILLRKPLIAYFRVDFTEWRKWKIRQSEKLLFLLHERMVVLTLRLSSKVIAIYGHLYRLARAYYIPDRRISSVRIGTDLERFSYCYQCRSRSNYTVGFVGRFSVDSGCDLLTEVARKMPNTTFLIVSEPPEHTDELPKNLEFTGFVRNEDVPKYLCQMDLFVSLKIGIGIPVAVMEALACGVPVAGRRDNLDGLSDKEGAIVLDTDNSDYIAEKITAVLFDSSLRGELSRRASRLAIEMFDVNTHTKKVYGDIFEVTGQKRKKPEAISF